MIKRNSLILFLIALMCLPLFISAGAYVDITAANNEISELQSENTELQNGVDELNAENTRLQTRNSELEGYVREANILLGEFRKNNGDLHEFYVTVNDAEQKRQLNDKMVQNRKKQNELEMKKQGWINEIDKNNNAIAKNKRMIGMKQNKQRTNENRIEFLQVSIEMSQGKGTSFTEVFSQADGLSSQADALIAK